MAEVVVLTSSHAHERRDSQITGYELIVGGGGGGGGGGREGG